MLVMVTIRRSLFRLSDGIQMEWYQLMAISNNDRKTTTNELLRYSIEHAGHKFVTAPNTALILKMQWINGCLEAYKYIVPTTRIQMTDITEDVSVICIRVVGTMYL